MWPRDLSPWLGVALLGFMVILVPCPEDRMERDQTRTVVKGGGRTDTFVLQFTRTRTLRVAKRRSGGLCRRRHLRIVVVEAWVCIICASRKMTRQSCRYGTCACQKKMRGITNNRGDRGREMFDSKPVGTRASRLVLFWQSGAPSIHSLQAAGGPAERFRFPQLAAAAARE